MFIPSNQDAAASTVPAATSSTDSPAANPDHLPLEPPPREQVRHLLLGTPAALQGTIRLLHKLGYAEPNDWSRPIPTGRANEMMAILTKRVIVE